MKSHRPIRTSGTLPAAMRSWLYVQGMSRSVSGILRTFSLRHSRHLLPDAVRLARPSVKLLQGPIVLGDIHLDGYCFAPRVLIIDADDLKKEIPRTERAQ